MNGDIRRLQMCVVIFLSLIPTNRPHWDTLRTWCTDRPTMPSRFSSGLGMQRYKMHPPKMQKYQTLPHKMQKYWQNENWLRRIILIQGWKSDNHEWIFHHHTTEVCKRWTELKCFWLCIARPTVQGPLQKRNQICKCNCEKTNCYTGAIIQSQR